MRSIPMPSLIPAAMDDPVPSDSGSQWFIPCELLNMPHSLEQQVLCQLKQSPGMRFRDLSVHRLQDGDGVCLSGVVELDDDAADVCDVARRVRGVDRVINRLIAYGTIKIDR